MPQVKQVVDVANGALHWHADNAVTVDADAAIRQLRILLPRHGRLRSAQRSVQRSVQRSAQSVMLPRNGWLRSVQRSVPTPHVC